MAAKLYTRGAKVTELDFRQQQRKIQILTPCVKKCTFGHTAKLDACRRSTPNTGTPHPFGKKRCCRQFALFKVRSAATSFCRLSAATFFADFGPICCEASAHPISADDAHLSTFWGQNITTLLGLQTQPHPRPVSLFAPFRGKRRCC